MEEFSGGKIKLVIQEKIGVLSLRAQLSKHMHIDYSDIDRLDHIGSGGSSKVYKSRLRSENEIVAVKVYKHRKRSLKMDIDMFVREVKILCQLDNPYAFKFYGMCLDDASNLPIITEFGADGSLCHFPQKQKLCLDLPGKMVIPQIQSAQEVSTCSSCMVVGANTLEVSYQGYTPRQAETTTPNFLGTVKSQGNS